MSNKELILKIDGILSEDFCKNVVGGYDSGVFDISKHDFAELGKFSVAPFTPQNIELFSILAAACHNAIGIYRKTFDINCIPDVYNLEHPSVVHFEKGDSTTFIPGIVSLETCKRFLGLNFYLNNFEGGEVEFSKGKIPVKSGTVVVYPPFWNNPVKENAPLNDAKYILKTFAQYTS